MWHVWRRRELHGEFSLGDLKASNPLEDLDADGKIMLKGVLNEYTVT